MLWVDVGALRSEGFLATESTFDEILRKIGDAYEVVVDTETSGLEPWKGDRLCGVGVAVGAREGYYLSFRHPEDNLPLEYLPRLWDALQRVPRLCGYNLKFDLAMMHQDGFDPLPDQQLTDYMVAARLCAAEQFPRLKLAVQLEQAFGSEARVYDDRFKEYLNLNNCKESYNLAPAPVVGKYCIGDVFGTWKLGGHFESFIAHTRQDRVWAQEQEVTGVLWDMEKVGIFYDQEYCSQKLPQLQDRTNQLKEEIYEIAGHRFNIGSSKQLTKAFNALDIHSPKLSPKTNEQCWDNKVLVGIDNPMAGKVLEVRGLDKILAMYFNPIAAWPDQTVHATHKNWGAVTGRMSCVNPPLQTLSKKVQDLQGGDASDEELAAMHAMLGVRQSEGGASIGRSLAVDQDYDDELDYLVSVRRLFVGRPEHTLWMFDYSQMEMRLFADYVKDPEMLALLNDPFFDFHDYVAQSVWNVVPDPDSALWKFYRNLAKRINFGLIYGIGPRTLAAQIQRTQTEAKKYKQEYFDRFPLAKKFIEDVIERVEERGYTFNRFGRKYWIDKRRAYVGVNYIVQGTAADIVKNRMVACHRYIQDNNLKSRMLTQVHDEMLFEIHKSEEWLPWKIQEIMQDRAFLQEVKIDTFLPVTVSKGCPSWANPVTLESPEKLAA